MNYDQNNRDRGTDVTLANNDFLLQGIVTLYLTIFFKRFYKTVRCNPKSFFKNPVFITIEKGLSTALGRERGRIK